MYGRQFSSTRSIRDLATCQLLGNIGTPTKFTTSTGAEAVRYAVAVNKKAKTSWFSIVAFDDYSIEKLMNTPRGSKALIEATMDVTNEKVAEDTYSTKLQLRHKSINVITRPKEDSAQE